MSISARRQHRIPKDPFAASGKIRVLHRAFLVVGNDAPDDPIVLLQINSFALAQPLFQLLAIAEFTNVD